MSGINKAIIVGRMGKDPEISYLPDGTAVCRFSVATSKEWKDKQTGEKREKTEWHNVVAWKKLAEICAKYLAKGKQVYIEGELQTRSWEKDGVKHYMTEIVASDMQMLGGNGAAGGGQQRSGGGNGSYQSPPLQEDDIPF